MLSESKNNQRVYILPLIVATLMFISIAELPYGFYTVMRIAISLLSVIYLYFMYSIKKEFNLILIPNVLATILWNPILPIHLDKETWVIVDGALGVIEIGVCIYTYFISKNVKKGNVPKESSNNKFAEANEATKAMFEEYIQANDSINNEADKNVEEIKDDNNEVTQEEFENIYYVESFDGEMFRIPSSRMSKWLEIDKKHFEEKMLELLCEAQLTGDFRELDEYINDDTEIEVCTRLRNGEKREIVKDKQTIIDYFIRQRNYKNEHKYNPEYQIVELIGDMDGEIKYNDGDLAILETLCKSDPRVKTMMLRIRTERYKISRIELCSAQKFGEYRIKQKEN